MTLNVVQFPTPNYKDVVKALRNLADEIEAGEWGEIGCCAVAIMGDTFEVFGSGPDSAGPSMAILFQAAIMRMAGEIERHGR